MCLEMVPPDVKVNGILEDMKEGKTTFVQRFDLFFSGFL